MKAKYFLMSLGLLFSINANCQIDRYKTMDLHPVSPTAFQFLKYTEMPVSEYTGMANVSVPLYNLKVDGLEIPMSLTYHGGGIRTTEEAGWSGLGWDIQAGGSIVQTINDIDDYANEQNTPPYAPYLPIKKMPDFFPSNGDGSPWVLPMYVLPPNYGLHGNGWQNPYPINNPTANQGYAIATDAYVPVNGNFDTRQTFMFSDPYYDAEPDIFVANFLGTTIKFIMDFNSQNGSLIILNKGSGNSGYGVIKTTNGFMITAPTGDRFYFEVKSVIKNHSLSNDLEGQTGSLHSGGDITSNIYFLSKIRTKNGQIITYNYTQTSLQNGYPNFTEKAVIYENRNVVTAQIPPGEGYYTFVNYDSRAQGGWSGAYTTDSYNIENYFYLTNITFPTGKIDFLISDRTDIVGGKKLDDIQLTNFDNEIVKSWHLNFSYFDASGVGGNGYGITSLSSENRSLLRLKLLDITDGNGGTYSFTYNNTALPKKNSYAQDYWGYYNGKLSNSSLIPNPTSLGFPALGNNGNDRNADINFVKAGMLESIKYPTGGKAVFDYELNEFDHSQVLGWMNTPQTIQGNGVRVHAITHYTDDNTTATKTVYSYEGGKLLNRLILARSYPYAVLDQFQANANYVSYYTKTEINANGVFSSNPLSSVNGVGYTKVTKQDVDLNNMPKGKIVSEFFNTEDINNPTIYTRLMNCNLPPIKALGSIDNGSVKTIKTYNAQNTLLKTEEYNYSTYHSDIYYGARIMGYGSLFYGYYISGVFNEFHINQNVIGYFPIYDNYTYLNKIVTTNYDETNNILVTEQNLGYDFYNQLNFKQVISSDGGYTSQSIDHAWEYYQSTGDFSLMAANKLSEFTASVTTKGRPNYFSHRDVYKYNKTYTTSGSNVVAQQLIINEHPEPGGLPETTSFSNYDPVNANLQEYTSKGIVNSMLWDYGAEYLTAEVTNAAFQDVAATSFESDGKGNWSFSGLPQTDVTAPTGKKTYALSGYSISKSGLNSGKNYLVSYWSNSGSYTVTGTISVATGKTIDGWTNYKHTISNITSTIVSGSGSIDEVRLYPVGSLMTTYTYKPLVGVTSQSDPNNHIIYYEYDTYNRLKLIRDEDKKIIKQYEYKYQYSVPTGSPQWQATGKTRCKPCPQNSNYITNILQQEERDINPQSPSYNLLHWIDLGTNSGCDVNAGWENTPTPVRCKKNIYGQNTGEQEQEQMDMNPCSTTYGQTQWVVIGVNYTICPVPVACNSSNCSGVDKKCVNNVCETGVKVYTSSVYNKLTGIWTCTYHYHWSDGSNSGNYTETSTVGCPAIDHD